LIVGLNTSRAKLEKKKEKQRKKKKKNNNRITLAL